MASHRPKYKPEDNCRKGLHKMVPGAFRTEHVKNNDNGRTYEVRRCLACQKSRLRNYWSSILKQRRERLLDEQRQRDQDQVGRPGDVAG